MQLYPRRIFIFNAIHVKIRMNKWLIIYMYKNINILSNICKITLHDMHHWKDLCLTSNQKKDCPCGFLIALVNATAFIHKYMNCESNSYKMWTGQRIVPLYFCMFSCQQVSSHCVYPFFKLSIEQTSKIHWLCLKHFSF